MVAAHDRGVEVWRVALEELLEDIEALRDALVDNDEGLLELVLAGVNEPFGT
jgi:hypothetical protein